MSDFTDALRWANVALASVAVVMLFIRRRHFKRAGRHEQVFLMSYGLLLVAAGLASVEAALATPPIPFGYRIPLVTVALIYSLIGLSASSRHGD